jgi:hypothetical protein
VTPRTEIKSMNGADTNDTTAGDIPIADNVPVIAARAAALAAPAAASDDAELIRLCDRLVAWEARNDEIYLTVADDDEAERQSGLLTPEYNDIRDRLYAIAKAPVSDAGRRAFARAAIASAHKSHDGSIILDSGGGVASYLAFGLCHSMAEGGTGKPPVTEINPDAELLALRQAFLEEEKIIHAWNAGTVTEVIGDAASTRWWEALRAMQDIPAATAEGVRIKADSALRALALGAVEDSGPTENFIAAFLTQLAGRAAT